ncbi:hypothetical protein P8452_47919 [Trifolium repens]|nr:hypothetical protein P8452_47919 [Trifolium repens]
MGDHEKQADDLAPSLVLWDVISTKIYPLVLYTGFGYRIHWTIKQFGYYEFFRIYGWLLKGLLTGGEYNQNTNQKQQPPRRLALLTYSGTPDLKGLKDIAETLPSCLDSSAANSIMPMNKPEQKKTLLLRFVFARLWLFE